ncbi:hypothetical protein SDC9_212264 [bioreactor metagenome]|uniref:Uncharacterized protein n=1 Tax=bioreactor metagenome TaxID=1076179 RepID=A0A645JP00_9ZZZZ
MFDPQTAGGLLISVAESDADRLLSALGEQNDWSRIIGHAVPQGEATIWVK